MGHGVCGVAGARGLRQIWVQLSIAKRHCIPRVQGEALCGGLRRRGRDRLLHWPATVRHYQQRSARKQEMGGKKPSRGTFNSNKNPQLVHQSISFQNFTTSIKNSHHFDTSLRSKRSLVVFNFPFHNKLKRFKKSIFSSKFSPNQ